LSVELSLPWISCGDKWRVPHYQIKAAVGLGRSAYEQILLSLRPVYERKLSAQCRSRCSAKHVREVNPQVTKAVVVAAVWLEMLDEVIRFLVKPAAVLREVEEDKTLDQ
jgi:hypothetical protein